MDARKKNVLLAVVEAYIQTGEPVGSKMISQLPQIHVSAATVRNDMAVLEELGYLEQPHTSAGRVPTYSGYRFYIDEVVEQGSLPDAERKRLDAMLGDESQLTEDLLIQSATTALSEVTKCATVVSDFAPKYSVISKVEVIPTGKRLYVVLLITSNGTIKNKACRLEFDLTEENAVLPELHGRKLAGRFHFGFIRRTHGTNDYRRECLYDGIVTAGAGRL